jgi:hypothetical protein
MGSRWSLGEALKDQSLEYFLRSRRRVKLPQYKPNDRGVVVISEYRGTCPRCSYLRALFFKELNSNEIHIECKKCGFEESRIQPKTDNEAQKQLFYKAQKRISIFESTLVRKSGFDGEPATPLMLAIHQQLAYILRLLRYQRMMDNDLNAVLDECHEDYDLTRNFWLAATAQDQAAVTDLDNQFGGFEAWIRAGLRSLGANEDQVIREIKDYWKEVDDFELEHIQAGGKPFTYLRSHPRA